MAHYNLIKLMARTLIPTSRLVDLFDQAVLYLHLGLEVDKVKKAREALHSYGIRTATDLLLVDKKASSMGSALHVMLG